MKIVSLKNFREEKEREIQKNTKNEIKEIVEQTLILQCEAVLRDITPEKLSDLQMTIKQYFKFILEKDNVL